MTNNAYDRSEIIGTIRDLLSDFVEDPDLELTEASSADDVIDWDSVNHVKLIMALEQNYSIRFNPDEVNSLSKVGDLVDLIVREMGSNIL